MRMEEELQDEKPYTLKRKTISDSSTRSPNSSKRIRKTGSCSLEPSSIDANHSIPTCSNCIKPVPSSPSVAADSTVLKFEDTESASVSQGDAVKKTYSFSARFSLDANDVWKPDKDTQTDIGTDEKDVKNGSDHVKCAPNDAEMNDAPDDVLMSDAVPQIKSANEGDNEIPSCRINGFSYDSNPLAPSPNDESKADERCPKCGKDHPDEKSTRCFECREASRTMVRGMFQKEVSGDQKGLISNSQKDCPDINHIIIGTENGNEDGGKHWSRKECKEKEEEGVIGKKKDTNSDAEHIHCCDTEVHGKTGDIKHGENMAFHDDVVATNVEISIKDCTNKNNNDNNNNVEPTEVEDKTNEDDAQGDNGNLCPLRKDMFSNHHERNDEDCKGDDSHGKDAMVNGILKATECEEDENEEEGEAEDDDETNEHDETDETGDSNSNDEADDDSENNVTPKNYANNKSFTTNEYCNEIHFREEVFLSYFPWLSQIIPPHQPLFPFQRRFISLQYFLHQCNSKYASHLPSDIFSSTPSSIYEKIDEIENRAIQLAMFESKEMKRVKRLGVISNKPNSSTNVAHPPLPLPHVQPNSSTTHSLR